MAARAPLLAALLLAPALAGCLGPPGDGSGGQGDSVAAAPCPTRGLPDERADLAQPDALHIYVNTTMGDLVAELYHERAPVTVANFVEYARRGFYEDTVFHRVATGFVIQGGGFTLENGSLHKKPTGDPIPLELHPELENTRGVLGMARTKRPHTATTQFFVNLADNSKQLGPQGNFPIAAFGKVVEGMDTVSAIADLQTERRDGRKNVPVDPPRIRCTSLDLPQGGSGVSVAPVPPTVHPAPNGTAQVPFQVRNGWGEARQVTVTPAGDATDVAVPAAEGATLNLTPGATALAVAEVPARANATAGVAVQANGTTVDLVPVRPRQGTGPAADRTNHTKVSVRYVGLFASGVPFDTNVPTVDDVEGLRILPHHGRDSPPFKVWTGQGKSPDDEYGSVIPGFRDAVVGLREGQWTFQRVPPEEGYQDGVTRWFSVRVTNVTAT